MVYLYGTMWMVAEMVRGLVTWGFGHMSHHGCESVPIHSD
jgi:hypothetical protein